MSNRTLPKGPSLQACLDAVTLRNYYGEMMAAFLQGKSPERIAASVTWVDAYCKAELSPLITYRIDVKRQGGDSGEQ